MLKCIVLHQFVGSSIEEFGEPDLPGTDGSEGREAYLIVWYSHTERPAGVLQSRTLCQQRYTR